MDIGRRGFLKGRFLTREGRKDVLQHTRALGPAPPWHSGGLDPEVCRRCDALCREACGEDVIRIHEADHALSGTPFLSFGQAGCTGCGDCARVCPMDGLDPERTCAPDIGTAVLDTEKCLSWNGVVCMSCGHSCPDRALALDRRARPLLDAGRCNGCGRCVGVCPARAIRVDWPDRRGASNATKPSVAGEFQQSPEVGR